MSSTQQPTLLVTGASGQLGRRVLELLLEAQAGNIIAATRTPEKLEDFRQRGVTPRFADFNQPESLVKAFTGVDRLLLISTDVISLTGERLKQHVAGVKAAEEAGVQHVIYTSLYNPDLPNPVSLASDHRGTEAALTASKMDWTFLRNNIYAEGQIGALGRAIQMGQLVNAAGDGKAAYVTREDCAQTAAAALASTFTGHRTLDITGPEALSQHDLAALASSISGKPVSYTPLNYETYRQILVSARLPPAIVELVVTFDAGIAQGFFSGVSTTVEELSGHKPMSVADFLAANRDLLLQPAQVH